MLDFELHGVAAFHVCLKEVKGLRVVPCILEFKHAFSLLSYRPLRTTFHLLQKCELLLLTIYCCPKSGFFIRKPKKRKEDFPDLQEHMWLNKIKHRLNKKAYHSVQHFVGDMRLIFQNHSKFYKSRFKNLGVIVGNKFEKTFQRVFSIEDTSKQLQPSQHTVLLT